MDKRERDRLRLQKYRKDNREKVNASNRAYRRANPEKTKLYAKRGTVKYRYGVTLAEIDSMRAKQKGLCAVSGCGRPATDIDHCHTTGIVRGLLCSNCNKAIGLLGDSVERIEGLLDYVEMST